ncbi:VCBS domain-containing protein [Alphaproteobacteria bacterium]|nr:VCBS domain-containing protein [Alphaproteobacteria bacterium]
MKYAIWGVDTTFGDDNDGVTTFDLSNATQQAQALVELIVDSANDAPVPRSADSNVAQFSTPAPTTIAANIDEGQNPITLNENHLGFEDYDAPEDDTVIFQNINVIGLNGEALAQGASGVRDVNAGKFEVRLQKNVAKQGENADWRDYNNEWTTFTLADLKANLIRIVHGGRNPDGDTSALTFTFDVTDGTTITTGQSVTVNVVAINDQPTKMEASTTRISTDKDLGDAVARFTTTDEESLNAGPLSTDPTVSISNPATVSQFTYELVAGDGDSDNHYFTINNNGLLSFKPEFDSGVYRKSITDSDKTYSVRIKVTDHGVGDGQAGKAPKSITRQFTFEVRDFDIDWDANSRADDANKALTETMTFVVNVRDTEAGEVATQQADNDDHVFTILPKRGYDPTATGLANASWKANNATWDSVNQFRPAIKSIVGGAFGDVYGTFTINNGVHANDFRIVFTPNETNELLQQLAEYDANSREVATVDTLNPNANVFIKDYEIPVEYRDGSGKIKKGTVKFTVEFRGKNDRSIAEAEVDATNNFVFDHIVPENADLTATGTWGFSDVDNGAIMSSVSIATSENGTYSTMSGSGSQRQLQGKYGTITVNEDGTWTYLADIDRLAQVQVAGNQQDGTNIPKVFEEFWFKVNDGSLDSLPTRIQIRIDGKKDKPVLQMVEGAGSELTDYPTDTPTKIVTTSIAVENAQTDPANPDDSYADTANIVGRWNAIDPDNQAKLIIMFAGNSYALSTKARPDTVDSYGGTILSGTLTHTSSVTLVGLFGDLTLHMDGTWEYNLDTTAAGTGRADRIAHDEQVKDIFRFQMRDGWSEFSNSVTLEIAILGKNDASSGVASTMFIADQAQLETKMYSDGRIVMTLGTNTAADDIVIEADGTLKLKSELVSYAPSGDETLQGIGRPDYVTLNGGEITLTNPEGGRFTLVRAADGKVTLTYDDNGTSRTVVLRDATVEIAKDNDANLNNDVGLIIGNVVENGARYEANGITRDEDGALGTLIVRGTLDAIDVDELGPGGRPSAQDNHTFVIKGAERSQLVTELLTAMKEYLGNGERNAINDRNENSIHLALEAAEAAGVIDESGGVKGAWDLFYALRSKASLSNLDEFETAKKNFQDYINSFENARNGETPLVNNPGGTAPDPDRPSTNPLKGALADAKTVKKGTYGTFYLNKYSGEWEYVLDNGDLDTQELNGGQVVYDEFIIIVTDEEGASIEKTVRVRVTGENDASILYLEHDGADARPAGENNDDYSAKEKGTIRNADGAGNTDVAAETASGQFGVFDIDADGRAVLSAAANSVNEGTASAREVMGTGHFSFEAANRVVSTTFGNADGDVNSTGSAATDNLTIDNAEITTWIDTDVTSNQPGSVRILGKFGLLSISADGTWEYHLFGEHASTTLNQNGVTQAMITRVNKLGDGEARTEHFAIRVKDAAGTPSNIIHLDITVTGTNDASMVTTGALKGSSVPPAAPSNGQGQTGLTPAESPITAGQSTDISPVTFKGTNGVNGEIGNLQSLVQLGYFKETDTVLFRIRAPINLPGVPESAEPLILYKTPTGNLSTFANMAKSIIFTTPFPVHHYEFSFSVVDLSVVDPKDTSYDDAVYTVLAAEIAPTNTAVNLNIPRNPQPQPDQNPQPQPDQNPQPQPDPDPQPQPDPDPQPQPDPDPQPQPDPDPQPQQPPATVQQPLSQPIPDLVQANPGNAEALIARESGHSDGGSGQQVSLRHYGSNSRIYEFAGATRENQNSDTIINAYGYFIPTDIDATDNTANLGLKGWSATVAGDTATYDTAAAVNKAEFRAKAESTNGNGVLATAQDPGVDMTIAGKYGVITLEWDDAYSGDDSTDGGGRWKWTYKLANAVNAGMGITQTMVNAVKELDEYDAGNTNTHPDEIFTFIITDSAGVETPHSITIDVRGSNDASIITSATVKKGAVTEAGLVGNDTLPATGQIFIRDDDDEHEGNDVNEVKQDTNNDLSDDFTFLVKRITSQHPSDKDNAGNPVVTSDNARTTDTGFDENNTDGLFGRLTINSIKGEWTYTLNNQNVDVKALDYNETLVEKFAIRIRDDKGAVSKTEYITITITGANDAPTVETQVTDNEARERGGTANGQHLDNATAGGFLKPDDEDGSDTPASLGLSVTIVDTTTPVAIANAAGASLQNGGIVAHTYGFFTFTWNGDNNRWDWTYTLADSVEWASLTNAQKTAFGGDNGGAAAYNTAQTALNALSADVNVSFTATFTDGDGSVGQNGRVTTDAQTFSIKASNDAPTVSVTTDDSEVTEKSGLNNNINGDATASGTITLADVDSNDTPASLGLSVTIGDTTTTVAIANAAGASLQNGGIVAHDYGWFTFAWKGDTNQWDWTYTLADSSTVKPDAISQGDYNAMRTALDKLNGEKNVNITFTATATDTGGLTATSTEQTITLTPADDHGTLASNALTKDSLALNDSEILATFKITDVDTNYADPNNDELISLSGDDATLFKHTVTRVGTSDVYNVVVTWAPGRNPSFNEADGGNNQYDVTLNITGAPDATLTVTVKPAKPEFVDNKNTLGTSDDTVITNNQISATIAEKPAANFSPVTINARQAGSTPTAAKPLDTNITYNFVLPDGTTNTVITVERGMFYIDNSRGGEVRFIGGNLTDQDTTNPDNSLSMVVRATDNETGVFTDITLTLNITNVDERPTSLDVTATNTASKLETFDDAGWTTVATFNFTDPDSPAQGFNINSLGATINKQGAEVQIVRNQIQVRGVDVAPNARNEAIQITLTPDTSGVGNELPAQTFTFTVNGEDAPARVKNVVDTSGWTSLDATANSMFSPGDSGLQYRGYKIIDGLYGNQGYNPIDRGGVVQLAYENGVGQWMGISLKLQDSNDNVFWSQTVYILSYREGFSTNVNKIAPDGTTDQTTVNGDWQNLVSSNTEPAASSGMNGELGSRQEMAHDGGNDANRDEMQNTEAVADIFIIDRVASDASNADLVNGFEAASDTIRVSSNLALGDHIAANGNIVGWKTEKAADGTQTVTIYAGGAVNDTKILAVIRNVSGQFGEENLYDASALITFKHLMNMQDGGAAGQQSLNGLDAVADIFQIDSQVSARDQADVIVNFTDGQDMIRIKAIDTAIADNGNQVSWKSVADTSDASKQDITIYAGAAEDPSKILAVIQDFDGVFDADDFDSLEGVTFAEIQ